MKQQFAKQFLRTAGGALGSYLDDAFGLGGKVGQNIATSALKAGKAKFAPQLVGKTGSEVPMLLREGAKSAIPTAGRLLGQTVVAGTGLAAAGIFGFVLSWNDLFYSLLLTGAESRTLPVAIAGFWTFRGIELGKMAVAILIAVIPVLILSYSIQKHLIKVF